MKYGKIPGLEKPVSRIVQGTVMLREDRADTGFDLLDAAYGAGINTFDLAKVYSGGESERVFGKWLADRSLASEVVVLDKGAHHSRDRQRVTPSDITSDLYDCLARLGIGVIDLFVLHRDDTSQPVGPIVDRLNRHVQEGLIRVFGGSNWTWRRVQEANEYAETHGLTGFAVSSPHFSLAEALDVPWENCHSITGDHCAEERAWYSENQMPLFTWSSLCGGFFSGRYTRENLEGFTEARDKTCIRCYASEANFRRLDRASGLARTKSRTTSQIVLAYLLCGSMNCFPLMAGWTEAEILENAMSSDLVLSQEEMFYLNPETGSPV